jgi:hypothetical protein
MTVQQFDAAWHEMRRISSRMTFFHKRVFPLVWFGFVLVFLAVGVYGTLVGGQAPPLPFLLMPAIMLVIGYIVMRKLIFDLVDEVWDVGDALIVKNGGREERIGLSEIMNVSYTAFMNPPRVTLTLRGPSEGGREISFCPPVRFVPFAKSPVITDLIERIDSARRRQS